MKFTLGLFAILAIISLGQAHQFPDFGEGPLHEDMQDILDLVPVEKIFDVLVDYMTNDNEVLDVLEDIADSTTIKEAVLEFQAIPEVSKFVAYLRKEGININVMNLINKSLDIKELVLPNSKEYSTMKRTGGLRGMFEDMKKHINYDVFISIYVDKLKTSEAFVNFINQIKSKNFQQIINKLYEIKSFQVILNYLEIKSVNLKIAEDILYLLWNITVPSRPSKTLVEELTDFINLIPIEKFLDIIIQYVNEDKKVQKALQFVLTAEYHDLLRALEALKEHQALVVYLEKAGLPVIEYIQEMHRAIGMEKYVPPKIEDLFTRKSLIKTQKIGDGMQGMFKDLYDVLPLDKIDALFQKKMKTSKVFVDFIKKITSKEMIKILSDLDAHKTYKEFITKTKEKGLDTEGSAILSIRIIGITVPSRSKTLLEELMDFINLIPIEKFLDIIIQYVNEDKQVQKALQFVLTAEYHDLLRALEALKEHQALVVYLEKAGLPIIEYIQEMHRAIGMEKYVPPKIKDLFTRKSLIKTQKIGDGMQGMFKDLYDVLPLDKIDALFQKKMKTSKVFVDFIKKITSKEMIKILSDLGAHKTCKEFITKTKEKGLDMEGSAILSIRIIGITVPSRSKTLLEELMDFINLIPIEKFLDIIIQYVNEDEKVQKALQFVSTAECHDLLRDLEALKEHQALVVYLEKAGLPIIEFIQEIHRAIGMEKYVPPKIKDLFSRKSLIKTQTQKIGDGMQGMIKDLYNVLPLNKIDNLFRQKMKTSKVFVDFIKKITSKEMIKILSDIGAHKTYKEFITKTKEKGLDLEGSANLSIRIIGLKPKF